MHGHFHGHAGAGFDALEVDVLDLLLVRVHLQVTQQNLVFRAGQFHLQDGAVKGFLLDGVPQGVVVDFDQDRLGGSAINDTGRTAGDAETAARTRALLCALKSDEFHNLLQNGRTATSLTLTSKDCPGSKPFTILMAEQPAFLFQIRSG